MLQVTYKKNGLKVSHVWFASEVEIVEEQYRRQKSDIYYLHGVRKALVNFKGIQKKQYTLIKNLELPEEDLFLSLGKHLRQYIKRSVKENLIGFRILEGDEILANPSIIDDCKKLYEKMFSDKGISSEFNRELFDAYATQNSLLLGVSTQNGRPIGFNAVIMNENDARLWLAAFDFRNDTLDSQVLSRAHQRLDWEMILKCKRQGIKSYDFGGVNSFENPNGIAKFKMAFEKSNRTEYYNYLVDGSLIGKIALTVKRILKK